LISGRNKETFNQIIYYLGNGGENLTMNVGNYLDKYLFKKFHILFSDKLWINCQIRKRISTSADKNPA
jgi:hypothetical protein